MAAFSTRKTGISSLARLRFILTTVFLFWREIRPSKAPAPLFRSVEAPDRRFLQEPGSSPAVDHSRRRRQRSFPVVLRELLETLGPTFVKLGQILSLRPDFVGEEVWESCRDSKAAYPPSLSSRLSRSSRKTWESPPKRFSPIWSPGRLPRRLWPRSIGPCSKTALSSR